MRLVVGIIWIPLALFIFLPITILVGVIHGLAQIIWIIFTGSNYVPWPMRSTSFWYPSKFFREMLSWIRGNTMWVVVGPRPTVWFSFTPNGEHRWSR